MNNYLQVLNYLKNYSGKQYRKPIKCETAEERSRMEIGAKLGKDARIAFTHLVECVEKRIDFKAGRISHWQNSGTFVSYFWSQLKRDDALDGNISISLFAEKSEGHTRFRVSVELAVDHATEDEKKSYQHILDIPLDEDLVYVSGGNNESEFRVLKETNNEEVKRMHLNKVQVSFIVDEAMCEEDRFVEDAILNAASNLIKYYVLAIDKETRDDSWWPSLEEYNSEITEEKWVDILRNDKLMGPGWGSALDMFYDFGGSATCSQIAEKYGDNPMSISGRCTQLAKAIHKETDCKLCDAGDEKNSYWPILFRGRKAKSDEKGNWVWKLRPELNNALSKVDILRYLKKAEEPTMQMTVKEAINQIKAYISAKGFAYDDTLIENYYLSLKSKPFVILAGTSGTGKTRLVKLFAEAIGAEYRLVSVRPDWSDGSDLFGHNDLNGNFNPGPVCEVFDLALADPTKPVFLCLDEMNLARVEYYLSDFLSVIESREKDSFGRIITSPIANYDGIPDNLYIVGTVNMDETTFPFSKKVLDRANTIEFSFVDLLPDFNAASQDPESVQLPNSFLRAEYLVLAKDCAKEREYVTKICDELQQVNEILVRANAHVGYRVRDEFVFYLLNNKQASDLISYEQAFDNEIMQKILPRIQGSAASISDMLVRLFMFCMNDSSGIDIESGNVGKHMQEMADNARYPKSASKIGYMMTRYEEDGFTSYWL